MAGRIGSIIRNNDPPKYGYGGPSRSYGSSEYELLNPRTSKSVRAIPGPNIWTETAKSLICVFAQFPESWIDVFDPINQALCASRPLFPIWMQRFAEPRIRRGWFSFNAYCI